MKHYQHTMMEISVLQAPPWQRQALLPQCKVPGQALVRGSAVCPCHQLSQLGWNTWPGFFGRHRPWKLGYHEGRWEIQCLQVPVLIRFHSHPLMQLHLSSWTTSLPRSCMPAWCPQHLMKSFKALSAMLCMPGQCISCFDHARICYCGVQEADSELAADDALVNVEVLKVREPDWTSTIVHPEGKVQYTRFCLFSSRRFNDWMSWEDHATLIIRFPLVCVCMSQIVCGVCYFWQVTIAVHLSCCI